MVPLTAHDELVRKILAAARGLGLLAHHCADGRCCDGAGFPDVVVAGRGRVIFREVKTGSGETTAGQDLWGWMLGAAWAVWREADWESGLVELELLALV